MKSFFEHPEKGGFRSDVGPEGHGKLISLTL